MTGRTLFTVAASLLIAGSVSAQTVVRAPFVRVETGGPYTYVRAPFVNLFVPAGPPPIVYGPPPVGFGPPPVFVSPVPPPVFVNPPAASLPKFPQQLPPGPAQPPQPPQPQPVDPKADPKANPDFVPPAPAQVPKAPSIEEFAKSFKPKAGNYQVTLTNPVSQQPEVVRFSLPGEPQRVRTAGTSIEFVYGPRQFVRIEFDQDGPIVITR